MLVPAYQTALWLALVVAALAAVFDLRTGLIPNRLIVAALALVLVERGLVEPLLAGEPVLAALFTCISGAAVCSVIPLALYLGKGLGGGDVKLFALLGAALGPLVGVEAQVYAFGFGALFALGYLAHRGTLFGTLRRVLAGMLTRRQKRAVQSPEPALTFRFGPAIFAGVLVTCAMHLSVR